MIVVGIVEGNWGHEEAVYISIYLDMSPSCDKDSFSQTSDKDRETMPGPGHL
jgi:hypothetical protein